MFKSLLPWKHTKTKVMVPEQTMEDERIVQEQKLIPCDTCGRTFLPLPLKKHAPICEKNATKKRKIFDSLKQRVEGTDLAHFHQKSYLKRQDSTPKTVEKVKKPSQWEESHQKLVDAIRSAKGVTRDMSPTKKQPSSIATASNERCPHCERQFGPKAFDRHVEWCKEHNRTRIQKSPANVLLAKERLEARTKYKVPPLNKSKKTTVKEKYSSTNIVQRTESICSVKSTPSNPLRRNLSVRKPKSVLDLGRKIEMSPKANEKIVSPAVHEKKITEPSKSLRSKRYCPPREKINLIHNENLESITVSPVKLTGYRIPAKKLVTWKEVSQKSPEKVDEESVIVVYENSVFKKPDTTKSQDFIEELKEILTTDQLNENCSSCDTLVSEDKIPISPKSQSFPEIKKCDISNSNIYPLPKSRSLFLDAKQKSENSLKCDDYMSSYTNLEEDMENLSIEAPFTKSSSVEYSGNLAASAEDIHLDSLTESRDYWAKTSSDSIFELVGKEIEEECPTKDIEEYLLNNAETFSSNDDAISTSTKEDANSVTSSLDADFAKFCIEQKEKFAEIENYMNNDENNEDHDSEEITVEDHHTEEMNKNDEKSESLVKNSDPTRFLSLESISSDSLLSGKSSDIVETPQITEKETTLIEKDELHTTFKFSKPMVSINSILDQDGNSACDYDVPKKRRKLNTTFIVKEPKVCLQKIENTNKNEVSLLKSAVINSPEIRLSHSNKDQDSLKCETIDSTTEIWTLPKIPQEKENPKRTKETRKASATKLPPVNIKPTGRSSSVGISATRSKIAEKNIQIQNDISSVFLTYQSNVSPPPSYDPFISAERQFMELLECDTIKPTTTKPLTARPHTTAHPVKAPAKKFVKSAEITHKKRASVIDPPVCFQDSDAAEDDFEMLENLINNQFNNESRDFYSSLNKQNKDDLNVILNQRKYSDTSSVDSSLINETDNLTIPEHFKFANYSPDSSEDTDITIQNDDVDLYSVQYDKKIEQNTKGSGRKNTKTKTKSNSSFGSGDASQVKKRTKSVDGEKGKEGKSSALKTKGIENNKHLDSTDVDLTVKPEDLFAVDDKMYAEYKIYEEMYLKEKEQMANTKKHRTKNQVKSYGIELSNEETTQSNKVSDDSAYGSLNRNSPKPREKLSPLRQRMDSASSSGSEIIQPVNQQRMSRFCHECGNKYPLATAKFCPECGVKRLLL